jgi:serine/threonine protein kinase
MEAVRHPNIVMFLGAVTTNPNYSIILEYCPKGSLWSYLQSKDNNIAWEERRRFSI